MLDLIKQVSGEDIGIEQHHLMLGIQPNRLRKESTNSFWISRTTAIKQITWG